MTAVLPVGYLTILEAAEMLQPAMYAGAKLTQPTGAQTVFAAIYAAQSVAAREDCGDPNGERVDYSAAPRFRTL